MTTSYYGRLLKSGCCDVVAKKIRDTIDIYRKFDEVGGMVMPYISAWQGDKSIIWYEFVSQGFLKLLGCGPFEAAEIFGRSIRERRLYNYEDLTPEVHEEVLDCETLAQRRLELRNEGLRSGKLDAVYKAAVSGERTVWLKDQAVIETYPEAINLSFGCLVDVTKEMEQKEFLEKIGYFDELTNLPKRRIMDRLFDINVAQIKRGHLEDFTFLMIDIDRFKQFNDNFGHKAGDFVLTEMADIMAVSMRREERLGRYGGEEFYGVCLGKLESGVKFAERLRKLIENHRFIYGSKELPGVTVSIGIAAVSEVRNFDYSELVEMADKRLYAAKESGRNRVVYS